MCMDIYLYMHYIIYTYIYYIYFLNIYMYVYIYYNIEIYTVHILCKQTFILNVINRN